MAHLVRHRTPAGDTVSTEVADLDEAVALVERLRNEELAEDVRVFAEVPLRFQTYVRVSVAADAEAPATEPAAPATEPAAPDAGPDAPPPATPEADTTEASTEAVTPDVVASDQAPSAPVPPPPGVLAPVRVEAPSADAEELVDATPTDGRRGLFHR